MGQTVLITGGTSGIGLAAAELFLQQKAKVVLMGRNEARGQQAKAKLSGKLLHAAENILYCQGDVAKPADCQRTVKAAAEFGRGKLDVLVNSAGIYFEKAIEDVTETDFAEMMDINVKGTYFMTQYAAEAMKQQGSGSIVNVSSDAGLQGNMLCSLYCATKGAVNLFTRAMALELGRYGIRINAVCPGDVLTPLTEKQLALYPNREQALAEMSGIYPLGRIADPKEVAETIVFLSSEKASFINGALLSVDGGLTS